MKHLIEAMGVLPSHLLAAIYGSLISLLVRYIYDTVVRSKRKDLPRTEVFKQNAAMFVIGTFISVYCTEPIANYFEKEANHFFYFAVGGSGVEIGLTSLKFLKNMFKNRELIIGLLELILNKLKGQKNG